jgi:hypothetical protein
MPQFRPFEFTDEFLEKLRKIKEIPVHFYNKDGQILIYKKKNVTSEEIDRLVRFRNQGIYYNMDDAEELAIKPEPRGPQKKEIPEGLTDTKLISEKYTDELTAGTEGLFEEIRQSSLNAFQARDTNEKMEAFFSDFANQEDAMTGLVNILEIMQSKETDFDVEMAVKRTVVAMALKTRGMHATSRFKDRLKVKKSITDLMMSSILCDIGCFQMKMPQNAGLSANEMSYIKKHPFLSYLMVAHEPSLSDQVKHNILTHHRPRYHDQNDNNYPNLKLLTTRLRELGIEFQKSPRKRHLAKDIANQLDLFRVNKMYNEDANVLAISSEFASLTSDVPWRKAVTPEQAIKMIINNSYFTYTGRIMREFLDYISISLCDNRKVLKQGDILVIASETHDGSPVFEACRIESIGRFQSRPGVRRIATVKPVFTNVPKLRLKAFDSRNIRIDRRKAYFELTQDDTRRIVYFVDPRFDREFHQGLSEVIAGTVRFAFRSI